MEAETFELSATVEQYVEPFADPVEDAADAFVVAESDPVAVVEPVEVVGFEDVAAELPLIEAAQSIIPGHADYLLRDSSTWTEDEWSTQLFGEPGHTWAEM